ncbi:protein regulator of cytokinesis 1-like [Cydia strobilella]|uniref:protein regulator of cytokinesis 1-like n=1 Tax=Cydia strobilella TaxID=1100964 RepID=UPI003006F9B6
MIALTDDVYKLFDSITEKVCRNVRQLMEQLWLIWSHVGVEYDVKVSNIYKLVQIEKDLHRDVLYETKQKLKTMEQQVEELKDETKKLSQYLSVDMSITEYNDEMMLFEYKKVLEDQIMEYREQLEQRRTEINRLLEWQHDLTDKLGVTFPEMQDIPLPPQEELDKLREHLEMLQSERDKRSEIFLHTQIEIKDIMGKLHIRPQGKFEHDVVISLYVDFKVTDLNMDRLAKFRQDLQEKYDRTNNRVLELRERLSKLWECLDEDQIYRDNFLQEHPGCHPATEAAIKEEIKRCDQIKRQKSQVLELRERLSKLWECLDEDQTYRDNFLQEHPGCHPATEAAIKEEIKRCDKIKRQKSQVLVANMRTKIELMWDKIMYSSLQRDFARHNYLDRPLEDTFTLHQIYLDRINNYYNEHKHIFQLVLKRKNLWLQQAELDALASEPGRYHNRKGNLLTEEKKRKAVENNLPKIEAQLREAVTEFEAKTGEVFYVNGLPLLQLTEDEKESRKAEIQKKLSARKQTLTPTTTAGSALFRWVATSPRGKRNSTAEKNRPPSKRQLITGSAPKAVSALTHNLSATSTAKRRVSGRLATKAIVAKAESHGATLDRKLDYGADVPKPPKANGSILKHKRSSVGKRRSGGLRESAPRPHPDTDFDTDTNNKNPLTETRQLTSHTDFKEDMVEKKIGRSSMVPKPYTDVPMITVYDSIEEINSPDYQKINPTRLAPMTPKTGKENKQHAETNLLYTPTRLTKSALKLHNESFAPRAPLSDCKQNIHGTNSNNNLAFKNTHSNMLGSKTQTDPLRTKPFV